MTLKGFNLLREQKEPPTLWEKIYAWTLGTARIIVIIVELIVVGAFVTRIIIDTKAKKIDKEVKLRQATLDGLSESEFRYREIQDKLSLYTDVWQNSSNYTDVVKILENNLIVNFSDLQVSIDKGKLVIRGEGDINRISDLETAIKSSEMFTNVETFEVDSTTVRGTRRITFGIRADIKNYNIRTM